MKKIVSTGFIILIVYFKVLSQFYDDFSDGEFGTMPAWEDPLENFTVRDGMLSLSAPASEGNAYIFTRSNYAIDAIWEFRVKLDFNPSNYNYSEVYLSSDAPDLSGYIYGYFVRIGGGKDEISLYARKGYRDQVVQMISSPAGITDHYQLDLRIKVTRDIQGEWQLFYSEASNSQYTNIAGYRESPAAQISNYFGIICFYTPTRHDKFQFDDIRISGTEWPDNIPPYADTIYCSGNNRIECRLNEKIFPAGATDPLNYSLDGYGSPDSVLYDPETASISLFWDELFIEGENYFLEIKSIMDLAGNVSMNHRMAFIYHDIISAYPGSIIINEIMADPGPPVGLPENEYIEVINITDRFMLLDNCRLNDRDISSLVIPPGQYAILVDEDGAERFGKFNSLVGLVKSWNPVNNEGEQIRLTASNGYIIDAVSYQKEWIDDKNKSNGGWSLELINPLYSCWGKKSWRVTIAGEGGTPGKRNSVYSVTVNNQYRGFNDYRASGNSLMLEFIDPVSPDISNDNFAMNGIEIRDIMRDSLNANLIWLILADSLEPGNPYSLFIRDLGDCTTTYRIDTAVSLGEGVPPPFLGILITEVMIDAGPSHGLPEEEYIELYNPASKIIDLSGLSLVVGPDTLDLPEKCLQPDEYRILCKMNSGLFNFRHPIGISHFPALNNRGERMSILEKDKNLVFDLDLNAEWFPGGFQGGISVEMIDTHNPCGQKSNWDFSSDPAGGTPGKANSVRASNPDNLGPWLESVTAVSAERVLLRFTEAIHTGSLIESNITVNGSQIIKAFEIRDLKNIGIVTSETLKPGIIYQMKTRNITDCAGNILMNKEPINFALPEPADSSDIIINEVLFNPVAGGVDFVEILNRSGKFIDLKNWGLSDSPEFSGKNNYPISDVPLVIAPGSIKAFTINREVTINHFPRSKLANILEVNKMPSLNDEAGLIIIRTGLGKVIDRFEYNEDMHHRLLSQYDGVSLERIDPWKSSNDPYNWHSASEQSGFGTPGENNSSISADSVIAGEIFVEPAVFLPESSSRNNQATIYFNFGKPGYVANIFVFDVNGKMIRRLANNLLVSPSGNIVWDGICDSGKKAEMGYYIIVVEVFNLDGTRKIFKNKVAVGAYF